MSASKRRWENQLLRQYERRETTRFGFFRKEEEEREDGSEAKADDRAARSRVPRA